MGVGIAASYVAFTLGAPPLPGCGFSITVYEPTEEDLETFRERAKKFYELGSTFGWSDGLYETVLAAMGK